MGLGHPTQHPVGRGVADLDGALGAVAVGHADITLADDRTWTLPMGVVPAGNWPS